MRYEEFNEAWVQALRESMLPTIGLDPIEESVGLRKLHQTREHVDSPALRGMLHKVRHLVEVEES